MGLEFEHKDGDTTLEDEEKEGLLIPTIATRGELDEFEQQNIEQAVLWYLGRTFKAENLFSKQFVCNLHKRMCGNVWAWAGEFRKTNKNIGVPYYQIHMELKNLLDDTKLWLANDTYVPDELTIRFKHRLVSIHCFANGNGRHSRLIADIIIEKLFKQPHYSWGTANLVKKGESRKAYITAVRAADEGDIEPLINFAKS